MHRRATAIVVLLLALGAAACQRRQPVQVAIATSAPPPSQTVALPTPSAPTPSATSTIAPTSTSTATRMPTPTPTATATPTAIRQPTATPTSFRRATVGTGPVNVRAGPGVTHPVLGQVPAGQTLDVLAATSDAPAWYEVCCLADGRQGWLRGDLLSLEAGGQDVALAQNVPTPPPVPTAAPAARAPAPAQAADYLAPAPPPPASGPPASDPFTGLPGGNLNRRPVFVCINNDPEARPQFGLGQADLVYEYLMEGRGITRYTALFWSQDVARIGPIRSARLINIQMTPQYGAALLCSGASNEVRYMLKRRVHFPYLDVDLDDPSNSVYANTSGSDYRTRLRTDSGRLERYVRDWNVDQIPSTRGLHFGDYGGGTPASQVDIPYPALARTAWAWNGSQWGRLGRNGAAYVDGGTGQQITADNVVLQWAQHQATNMVEDSLGSTGIQIVLTGSGPVKILRDGKAIDGTWRADDPNQPPEFFDASGAPILLHPGRTWFEILEPHYQLGIK